MNWIGFTASGNKIIIEEGMTELIMTYFKVLSQN
jgi:hypothetical protein